VNDQQQLHQQFEQARLSRAKAEGKCLLGIVAFTPIGSRQQQAAASGSPLPGDSSPAADKEQQ